MNKLKGWGLAAVLIGRHDSGLAAGVYMKLDNMQESTCGATPVHARLRDQTALPKRAEQGLAGVGARDPIARCF